MRICVASSFALSGLTCASTAAMAQEGASLATSTPASTSSPPEPAPGGAGSAESTSGPDSARDSAASDPTVPIEGSVPKPSGTGPSSAPHPSSHAADLSKELKRPVYKKMSLSIGSAHGGRQVRPKKLRASPVLSILKKGSDKMFGHPSLVLMLQRSAKQVAKSFSGSKLVVGDVSSEDGGPLEGHHSHQSGRDADVLFYARDAKGKQVLPKKFVQYDANGRATDGSGFVFDDERNWALVESWTKDKRAGLKYIFVARWLRQRLLSYALKHPKHKDYVPEAAALFLQPEGAEPHDDHFHVRIKCPDGQEKICIE